MVILNLFLLLVPEGKYEKYVSAFTGVLIMLISVTLFSGKEISTESFDLNAEVLISEDKSDISAVALEQWIEGIAASRIKGAVSVKVFFVQEEIERIEISTDSAIEQEDLNWLATQCDIEIDKFLIK